MLARFGSRRAKRAPAVHLKCKEWQVDKINWDDGPLERCMHAVWAEEQCDKKQTQGGGGTVTGTPPTVLQLHLPACLPAAGGVATVYAARVNGPATR